MRAVVLFFFICLVASEDAEGETNKRKCPELGNSLEFSLWKTLCKWNVVEYYSSASSGNTLSYNCMKVNIADDDSGAVLVPNAILEFYIKLNMNFTYRLSHDPEEKYLQYNTTWCADMGQLTHWTKFGNANESINNAYLIDINSKKWALFLLCSEKEEEDIRLGAIVLSRRTALSKNDLTYLRSKLPSYGVDMKNVFPVSHKNCPNKNRILPNAVGTQKQSEHLFGILH